MISAKRLYGKTIDARDGHIGSVHDLYFDDQVWTILYLVIDSGNWLPGRNVLIAPDAILQPWHGEAGLPLNLTKDQIRSSPDIDTTQPVSRKAEHLLHSHYGWIPHWAGPGVPVAPPPPQQIAAAEEEGREGVEEAESPSDRHLRSTKEVMGCRLLATDREIGRVVDFILDDDCKRILFLAIDLEEWLSEKEILVPARIISKIDWASSRVKVEVSRRVIEASQEYKPAA